MPPIRWGPLGDPRLLPRGSRFLVGPHVSLSRQRKSHKYSRGFHFNALSFSAQRGVQAAPGLPGISEIGVFPKIRSCATAGTADAASARSSAEATYPTSVRPAEGEEGPSGVATAVLNASTFLAQLVGAAEGGTQQFRGVTALRGALSSFSAAVERAEDTLKPFTYNYDVTDAVHGRLLKPATPATPAAVAAAASTVNDAGAAARTAPVQLQQQQRAWKYLGSPFYILLLQAVHAAKATRGLSPSPTPEGVQEAATASVPYVGAAGGAASLLTSSSSIEAAAAEVAAFWQLQVAKDLRRLRHAAEALQQAGGSPTEDLEENSSALTGTPAAVHCLPQQDVDAAVLGLLCSAAEAVALLAEMQMKHSVRDVVPTLLLVLERVRLSRERRQGQLNPQLEEQQKKDGLVRQCEAEASLAASAEATAATTITARSPASQAPEAGVAAEATIRCLHALGRCQLFSEKLLQVVSTDHIAAADADSLALYLFECGRMGLRCRRWIDMSFQRALEAVNSMSAPSLLLACAGLYRFCTEWKEFYLRAAPRLLNLLKQMDYYQLRLMLRLTKHLNPSLSDPQLCLLSRGAARLLTRIIPTLDPQQLCCVATFVERRSTDTPEEYGSLTRSLVSALEATAPVDISCAVTHTGAAISASSAATATAKLAESASLAGDPLSLVHPLHDLVDVVDCLASHGLQSSLVPRIESVLSARYTEIEYSVNFTLWLICLDAFSRVEGHYPHLLLQHISDSICRTQNNANSSKSSCSGGNIGSDSCSNAANYSRSSLIDSLSVLQRLKFIQALTRLSFLPMPIVQVPP